MIEKKIPSHLAKVLLILTDHIAPLPESLKIQDRQDFMLTGLGRFINELTPYFRFGLLWAIRFIEWMPVFFGYGFKKFSRLSSENQSAYIKTWSQSQVVHKREMFKAIKGLITVVALSDKRLWPYFGYAPEEHLKERIQLHEQIINETRATNNI